MRTLLVILSSLLILIQYPLWLGKGGWLRVWDLERQLVQQRSVNGRLSARNEALAAEVADLRDGSRAIEERARYDLGMVKPGEVFVQINEAPVASDESTVFASVIAARSGGGFVGENQRAVDRIELP